MYLYVELFLVPHRALGAFLSKASGQVLRKSELIHRTLLRLVKLVPADTHCFNPIDYKFRFGRHFSFIFQNRLSDILFSVLVAYH